MRVRVEDGVCVCVCVCVYVCVCVCVQWHPEVRENCPSQPVMLVGCKADVRTEVKNLSPGQPRPALVSYDQVGRALLQVIVTMNSNDYDGHGTRGGEVENGNHYFDGSGKFCLFYTRAVVGLLTLKVTTTPTDGMTITK